MGTIDLLIIICLAIGLIHGLRKGFISQVMAILSLILGVWLSFKFSGLVCGILKDYITVSGTILQVIAFSVIMIIVVLGLHLVGKALAGIVKLVMLGWLDKLLGVAFSLLKVALIVGLVLILIDSVNQTVTIIPKETIDESVLYQPVRDLAVQVFPYLKGLIFNK